MKIRSGAPISARWLAAHARTTLCAWALLVPAFAFAQAAGGDSYPNRPIRMIAPFPPGNASDLVGRIVGEPMTRRFGQPIVVDNRPGASGIIGAELVAKAAPDGHTLLMTSTSFAINTAARSKLPFDIQKDFQPVSLVSFVGMVLVVNPQFPATNTAQFVSLVRQNPGKFNYANVGAGTIQHLTMELFLSAVGGKIQGVPFKGSAAGLIEVMSGNVPIMFDAISSAQGQIRAGKVRALVTAGSERSSFLPDVPTAVESGMPELSKFNVRAWIGLLGPAGMPAPITKRLTDAVVQALQLPEVRERLQAQGLEANVPTGPERFAEHLRAEISRWAAAANAAKLEKE